MPRGEGKYTSKNKTKDGKNKRWFGVKDGKVVIKSAAKKAEPKKATVSSKSAPKKAAAKSPTRPPKKTAAKSPTRPKARPAAKKKAAPTKNPHADKKSLVDKLSGATKTVRKVRSDRRKAKVKNFFAGKKTSSKSRKK